MEHTFVELKKKTVSELREIAAGIEHEAVKGFTQLNKEHLLKSICTALNIDMHEHHRAVAANKTRIKTKIKSLKKKRDEALSTRNAEEHKKIRHLIHVYKRELRKAVV